LTALVQVKGEVHANGSDAEHVKTRSKRILHVAHAPHHKCVVFDESVISREPPKLVDEGTRLLHPATQKRFQDLQILGKFPRKALLGGAPVSARTSTQIPPLLIRQDHADTQKTASARDQRAQLNVSNSLFASEPRDPLTSPMHGFSSPTSPVSPVPTARSRGIAGASFGGDLPPTSTFYRCIPKFGEELTMRDFFPAVAGH